MREFVEEMVSCSVCGFLVQNVAMDAGKVTDLVPDCH